MSFQVSVAKCEGQLSKIFVVDPRIINHGESMRGRTRQLTFDEPILSVADVAHQKIYTIATIPAEPARTLYPARSRYLAVQYGSPTQPVGKGDASSLEWPRFVDAAISLGTFRGFWYFSIPLVEYSGFQTHEAVARCGTMLAIAVVAGSPLARAGSVDSRELSTTDGLCSPEMGPLTATEF